MTAMLDASFLVGVQIQISVKVPNTPYNGWISGSDLLILEYFAMQFSVIQTQKGALYSGIRLKKSIFSECTVFFSDK